jgi:signal transduction histidine kinase
MEKTPEFLNQNVFKVIFQNEDEETRFKYIQLKIKSIVTGKKIEGSEISKLIQLVDISDKILYIEVKAEHSFLEMINAAVSHELRNPLNSLIGQSCNMKEFFSSFK